MSGPTVPDGLRVLDRLSETSLGVLYRAEYLDSRDEVELLILHPAAAGSEPTAEAPGLAHVRDQLDRAARIKHPNVASVRAMGETEEGTHWVAFEVFQGELLSEMLSARDVLAPNEAIDLILQAAAGLQAAHEAGLVHGHLSPATILVTRPAGSRPLVKLIGFGQVQRGSAPPSAGGNSSRYAAPERLAGDPPDERSDVFSLGAVLQHLLTGAPPSVERNEALPIPEAVAHVLAQALESPPDDRFQTVAAFARALGTATSKPPTQVRSGARRPRRLGRVLAVVVALAIAILWLWLSTERSRLGDAGGEVTAGGEPVTTGQVREPPPDALESARLDGRTVSDSTLVDVRSADSTIQVELRYASANNFTGAPLPGYDARRALLRSEAAAALGRVQTRLRGKGLGLKVFDAYRPVSASRAMVDWAERAGRRALLESGYIAQRSRHNLGMAVDLTLVDLATGTELPMVTTSDRQILTEAMESEGFRPHGEAWWHFNYPLQGAAPQNRAIR